MKKALFSRSQKRSHGRAESAPHSVPGLSLDFVFFLSARLNRKLLKSNDDGDVKRIGTLRSNDADGNENVKKTIGLISKTTTLHVHHAFLYISFLFLHDYDVKMPNFAFYGGCKQATTKFYFSFSELGYGPLKFSFRRARLHLTK